VEEAAAPKNTLPNAPNALAPRHGNAYSELSFGVLKMAFTTTKHQIAESERDDARKIAELLSQTGPDDTVSIFVENPDGTTDSAMLSQMIVAAMRDMFTLLSEYGEVVMLCSETDALLNVDSATP
jgi:NADPH-dependent curcumin reductase CurA